MAIGLCTEDEGRGEGADESSGAPSSHEGPLPMERNFGALGGAMARRTWAYYRPLRGSPWVLKYPYCHHIITQNHPRGDRRVSDKGNFSKNSQVPLQGPKGGGGSTGGTRSLNRDLHNGLGGQFTRKKLFRTQVQVHTQQLQ